MQDIWRTVEQRGVFSMAFSSVTPTSSGFQAAFLRNPSCKHWRIKKDRKKSKKKKKQKGGSAGDCGCFDAHRQQSKKRCAPAEFPFGFHFWAAFADGQHDVQCGSLLALQTSPSLCHLETKKPSACRAGRALQCSPVWQGTACGPRGDWLLRPWVAECWSSSTCRRQEETCEEQSSGLRFVSCHTWEGRQPAGGGIPGSRLVMLGVRHHHTAPHGERGTEAVEMHGRGS